MSQRDVEKIAAEVIAEGPKALLGKMGIAEVTGCADCPLRGGLAAYEADLDDLECKHPAATAAQNVRASVYREAIRVGNFDAPYPRWDLPREGAPDWCPLRAAPLVVRLKP